jgi:hypothetical protein
MLMRQPCIEEVPKMKLSPSPDSDFYAMSVAIK